jgi:hypothetical protein
MQDVTMRCRAFTGEGIRKNRIRVDADGTVRVFDAVAGYYTTCHVLGAAAQRRAKRMAAQIA